MESYLYNLCFPSASSLTAAKSLLEGICRGEIISQPQGKKGFGYDPVFRADGFEQTFAELEAHQKNEISHRGRALQKFIEFLG